MKKSIKKTKTRKIKNSAYGFIGVIRENRGLVPIVRSTGAVFLKRFPSEKDDHFFSHKYSYMLGEFFGEVGFYSDLYNYLDIGIQQSRELSNYFDIITSPASNRTPAKFKRHFEHLINILERTDRSVSARLHCLSEIECIRLEEAMRCVDANCNLAAVVMAVSAVEYRLHKLLLKTDRKVYLKEFERAPLGGIVELFRRDTRYVDKKYDKLKRILPDRHKHLVEILNDYRIFSAHPKEEKMSNQAARSILSFCFLALLDERLQLETKKPKH